MDKFANEEKSCFRYIKMVYLLSFYTSIIATGSGDQEFILQFGPNGSELTKNILIYPYFWFVTTNSKKLTIYRNGDLPLKWMNCEPNLWGSVVNSLYPILASVVEVRPS